MSRLKKISENKFRRTRRVRSTIFGTAQQPRLSIFVSNRNITAQLIDDEKGATLAYSTTANTKTDKGTLTDKADEIGKDIAKKAKAKKVKKVVFDRGPKLYHGRIKALADAAREEGLEL